MHDGGAEHSHVIVDAIPYPVIYILADGAVGFTNRAFRRANKVSREQVDGQAVEKLLSAEESDNGRAAFLECLHGGRRVSREGFASVPGANAPYCKYVYEPVRDADGEVQGVCVTVVDLTEIRNAEAALRASHVELQRSNRDLEQFAYVASHDLKAPLRSIEVLAGWLSEDLADYTAGDVQENLSLLQTRTARMNRLLDDLLTYSRAGRKVGEVCEVDVAELVAGTWSLLAPPAGFELRVAGTLPSLTTFRAPLEQVFRNLIANAIKHHPGPIGSVTIGAEQHGDHYVFTVTDDGAGIPEAYRERIYQMFQTLHPRDEVEGSGMGLAIVSRVVEWQHGRVWHEPGDPCGTTFKFEWKVLGEESAERLMKSQIDLGTHVA
jgi:PAS domain S-box-containing protein